MFGIVNQAERARQSNPYLNQQQQYMMMLLGNGMMPSNLQLNPSLGRAEGERARQDVLRSTVAPQVADLNIRMGDSGLGNSTFAAAQNASLRAEGSRMAEDAAQDAIDRAYNRTIAARSSYFNGEGGLASGSTKGALAAEDRERQQREENFQRIAGYGQTGLGVLSALTRPSYSQPFAGAPVQQGPSVFSQFGSGFAHSPLGQFAGGIANGIYNGFRSAF